MADETPTGGWTIRVPKPSKAAVKRALWWIGLGAFAGLQLHMLAKIEGWKVPAGGISCNGCKPSPTPVPEPTPDPVPKTQAIAIDGLAVLFLYESNDKITPQQKGMDTDTALREYLESHCAADPASPVVKAYHFWDKDVTLRYQGTGKVWLDAMARPRSGLPWLIISTPKNGSFEGPWPADAAKALELIRQYGGQ